MQFFPFNWNNNPNNTFKTPLSINDFQIIKDLGAGAYSSIYIVKYKQNGNIYVMKKFDQINLKNKDAEICYIREKSILNDITKRNYPYIIKLYIDFEDVNSRYLIMEYCEGKTLNKLGGNVKTNGYINEELVIHILTQLLETLTFLHDKCHIIHRSIKPECILLDNNNNIKLIGFGFSTYFDNQNDILISNKSIRGTLDYFPPEILSNSPFDYDYKIDIFGLGFTIYSLMNPSEDGKINLPQETKMNNGIIQRIDNYKKNNFYNIFLIEFVQLLYENDVRKRPTASRALALVQGFNINKNMLEFNKNNNFQNNNPNLINAKTELNNYHQKNNNIFMSNLNNINNEIFININNNNSQNNIMNPLMSKTFMNKNSFKENEIRSAMKNLLLILSKLDNMNNIKNEFNLLFSNCVYGYKEIFLISLFDIFTKIQQFENGIINKNDFSILIDQFIQKINFNNSDKSNNIPKVLYYTITSIIRNELSNYFNNAFQNNIFDSIIQNNYSDFSCILPMDLLYIHNDIKDLILNYKDKYKGPFVDNFYFLTLFVVKCPSCNNYKIAKKIAKCFTLEINNPQNNISSLITDFFIHISEKDFLICQFCGQKNNTSNGFYCLNLPQYLVLDFDNKIDKYFVNFNGDITIQLYNGKTYQYQYLAGIYKKINNPNSSFFSVIKSGNEFLLYNDDKIEKCPETYINFECPSLVIYKKISW